MNWIEIKGTHFNLDQVVSFSWVDGSLDISTTTTKNRYYSFPDLDCQLYRKLCNACCMNVADCVMDKLRPKEKEKKVLTLHFVGSDSWDRPVYKDDSGNLYVDTDPRKSCVPVICTKCRNDFDGEPDTPVEDDTEIIFVPRRETW